MANMYEPRMRSIRNDLTVTRKEADARCGVIAWIREAVSKMEDNGFFTSTEIADIMWQWFNESIQGVMEDELSNEKYPMYEEVDSAMGGFLVKGQYYCLYENEGTIQIFGEDESIRVKPAQIIARNGIVDIRLKDPNITLFFALRNNYKAHHMKWELYKIFQNLW